MKIRFKRKKGIANNKMSDWTCDIEFVLDSIGKSCVILANEHKDGFFLLTCQLKYFRLPIIILSSINRVVSVGFSKYLKQEDISLTTCFLALTCTIVGCIELYLGIQKRMEVAQAACKVPYSIDRHL